MKALVLLQLRLLRGYAVIAISLGVGALIWFAGIYGEVGPVRVFAAVVYADLLLLAWLARRVNREWTVALPLRSWDLVAARLLVTGGIWLFVVLVLESMGGRPDVAAGTNLLLLGLSGLFLVEATAKLASSRPRILLEALIGGALFAGFLGAFVKLEGAGWTPTPRLAAAAVGLLALTRVTVRREELAPTRSGADEATSPTPTRTRTRSLLGVAWLVPLSVGWAALLLLMSVVMPLTGDPRVLGALFVAAIGPLLLQASLDGYRGVLPWPLSLRTRFRVFLLPAWAFVALCLFLQGAVAVGAGADPVAEAAQAFALLAVATAAFRIQVGTRRRFEIAFGSLMLVAAALVVLAPVLLEGPASLWHRLLALGGGAGAFVVAGAGAGVSTVLFLGLRSAFARLQWTDLPPTSWRTSR